MEEKKASGKKEKSFRFWLDNKGNLGGFFNFVGRLQRDVSLVVDQWPRWRLRT